MEQHKEPNIDRPEVDDSQPKGYAALPVDPKGPRAINRSKKKREGGLPEQEEL